jgi:type II secretory pathway pseudopilin PulG
MKGSEQLVFLRRRTKGGKKNERGFILLTTYLLVSVFSILSLALFSRGATFLQAAERSQNRIVAFNMAEAGIDQAINQLAQSFSYTGTNGYVDFGSNFVEGGYQVVITSPDPAGNPNVRLIQATGFAPSNNASSRAYEVRAVTSYMQLGGPDNLFEYAVFASTQIDMGGSAVVDSYDSNLGPYGPANMKMSGDIGTDSVQDGAIKLNGSFWLRGDLIVGPNGDPDLVINKVGGTSLIVDGETYASENKQNFQPQTTNAQSSGALKITGQDIHELEAGTYHFDSLNITGGGQLSLKGPTVIYVDGNVDLGGRGVMTQGNLPPNFILYANGNEVKLSGGSHLYGGIYAPNASVTTVGSAALFGALVAKDYKLNGSAVIHFDEALKDIEGKSVTNAEFLSWDEGTTAAWQ